MGVKRVNHWFHKILVEYYASGSIYRVSIQCNFWCTFMFQVFTSWSHAWNPTIYGCFEIHEQIRGASRCDYIPPDRLIIVPTQLILHGTRYIHIYNHSMRPSFQFSVLNCILLWFCKFIAMTYFPRAKGYTGSRTYCHPLLKCINLFIRCIVCTHLNYLINIVCVILFQLSHYNCNTLFTSVMSYVYDIKFCMSVYERYGMLFYLRHPYTACIIQQVLTPRSKQLM